MNEWMPGAIVFLMLSNIVTLFLLWLKRKSVDLGWEYDKFILADLMKKYNTDSPRWMVKYAVDIFNLMQNLKDTGRKIFVIYKDDTIKDLRFDDFSFDHSKLIGYDDSKRKD